MALFHRKPVKQAPVGYNTEKLTPAIRCSICTGEQVAGFRDRATGAFEEQMLLRDDGDLARFRSAAGLGEDEEIVKFY